MRSLKLCLLAFLTSCMLSKIQSAPPEFCPHLGTGKDCYHDSTEKLTTNKANDILRKDFAWTTESSFDLGKAVPVPTGKVSDETIVEIDMHRALYIVPKNQNGAVTLTFHARDKDACKLIYKQHKDFDTAPYRDGTSFTVTGKALIAVLDPGCILYTKFKETFLKTGNEYTIYHVFSRHLTTAKLSEIILENSKKEQGTFIHSNKKGYYEGHCNADVARDNLFFDAHKEKFGVGNECYTNCKNGGKFEYQLYKDGGISWANKFKLSHHCEWMAVYPDTLERIAPVEVSLRHSFVKLPLELKVTAMDFQNAEKKGYEVIISYYAENEGYKMVIANSHGRAVNSYAMYPSKQTVMIAFSHDDCLTDVIGGTDNGTPKKYEDFEFAKSLNLAARIALERDSGFTVKRYMRDGKTDPLSVYTDDRANVEPVGYNKYIKEKGITDYTDPPADVATTEVPIDHNLFGKTAKAADSGELTDDDLKKTRENEENERAEKLRRRRLFESKNYFTWAIPAGFGAGSFASFLICNIMLFVFKRSLLIFWYKAMYKRYGSDTTMGAGTTMGNTMGGETIGGGTTMGGTTAGGTTAGGETTGSTTAA